MFTQRSRAHITNSNFDIVLVICFPVGKKGEEAVIALRFETFFFASGSLIMTGRVSVTDDDC